MNREVPQQSRENEKELGMWHITLIGVDSTIGTSIFTLLGSAINMAGPSVVFSFLIAGVLSILVALIFTELSATFPESAGAYEFAKKAYGGYFSFLTGGLLTFSNIIYGSLSALGFGLLLSFLVGGSHVHAVVFAIVAVLFFSYLNVSKVRQGELFYLCLVAVLIIGFFLFGIMSYPRVSPLSFDFMYPKQWKDVFKATAFVFVSYFGFESIANVSEQVSDPSKHLFVGIILSILISMTIYLGLSYIAVSAIDWSLETAPRSLFSGSKIIFGKNGIVVMGFLGSIGTLLTLNVAIRSSEKLIVSLSKDRFFPEYFAKHRNQRGSNPVTTLIAVFMVIFIATGLIEFITNMADVNLILALSLVNFSVIMLRKKRAVLKRPFKIPLVIPLVCNALFAILLFFLDALTIRVSITIILIVTLMYLFRLTHPRTWDLTIGGLSFATGVGLFTTLTLSHGSDILSFNGVYLSLYDFLFIGVFFHFVGAFFCVYPLGKLVRRDGRFSLPITQKSMKGIAVLKNTISGMAFFFAAWFLFVFYGIIYDIVYFPQITTYTTILRFFAGVTLLSSAFTLFLLGSLLHHRKYV